MSTAGKVLAGVSLLLVELRQETIVIGAGGVRPRL